MADFFLFFAPSPRRRENPESNLRRRVNFFSYRNPFLVLVVVDRCRVLLFFNSLCDFLIIIFVLTDQQGGGDIKKIYRYFWILKSGSQTAITQNKKKRKNNVKYYRRRRRMMVIQRGWIVMPSLALCFLFSFSTRKC